MRPTLHAALALLALSATAARAQVSTSNPAAVQPGTYQIEPSHTRVLFAVSHMGFSTWYGDFTGASGTLVLDPAHPAASTLTVSVPVASVQTTNTTLDGELKQSDWLNAARYPVMTFKADHIVPNGRTAQVTGLLTLHGFTHPVTLNVTFNGAGTNPLDRNYTVGFDATGTLKRSAFGVNKYVPLIGDDVTLILSAAFEKK